MSNEFYPKSVAIWDDFAQAQIVHNQMGQCSNDALLNSKMQQQTNVTYCNRSSYREKNTTVNK